MKSQTLIEAQSDVDSAATRDAWFKVADGVSFFLIASIFGFSPSPCHRFLLNFPIDSLLLLQCHTGLTRLVVMASTRRLARLWGVRIGVVGVARKE